MNKRESIIASVIMLSIPIIAMGADLDSNLAKSGQRTGNPSVGAIAHEEVIDGVKAIFKILNMKESMLLHGTEMPKGIRETHHLAVMFTNTKSNRLVTEGQVRVKILTPDRTEQVRDLVEMRGHFGADVDLSKKGRYGIMVKFRLEDEPVQEAKFWYTVH